MKWCSFWEMSMMSKTIAQKNCLCKWNKNQFSMYNVLRESPENSALWYSPFFLKLGFASMGKKHLPSVRIRQVSLFF